MYANSNKASVDLILPFIVSNPPHFLFLSDMKRTMKLKII